MSVATGTNESGTGRFNRISTKFIMALVALYDFAMAAAGYLASEGYKLRGERQAAVEAHGKAQTYHQMGAKRIGSLAIGIGVVGIVLNQMSDLDIVANSTGVIDVGSIFQTAGSGLNLLVVGVIIAAAAVLLSLWSGF